MDLIAAWPWLAGLILFMALLALWWWFPQWQLKKLWTRWPSSALTDLKVLANVEDNFRNTTGQLIGGAAVLVGAAFAYLQFQQQQTAAHDLLISNQVAKGFELLGNKDNQIQQRLGGIYALEGVMKTSKEYYQPVLEALCAFVRDNTKKVTEDDLLPNDVQAALTVIGRRKEPSEAVLDLTLAQIKKANLGGANLKSANLSGANLSNANLINTNLSNANLVNTNLSGAVLNRADLSGALLSGARLSGADLNGAKLSGANLGDPRIGAYLGKIVADLSGALHLEQAQLDQACGTDVKLDPPLTIKPCPATPAKPPVRPPE